MIIRQQLLDQLASYRSTDLVKVITGIRRAGKSCLLDMYNDALLQQGVPADHIIHINFEDFAYADITDAHALYQYVTQRTQSFGENDKAYLQFDEIQLVAGWQKAINSFRVSMNADITITGSNAQLLSGEMATLLSGRYVTIPVFPLSFREFLQFRNIAPDDARAVPPAFREYMDYGGFPMVVLADAGLKDSILASVFDTVLLKDITARAGSRDPEIIRRLSQFLASAAGQLISPDSIAKTLTSAHVPISGKTAGRYLRLFNEAYLFEECRRYDIRGKEYLRGTAKQYIADTGLQRAALGSLNGTGNRGSRLESIVYTELRRRGYDVSAGVLEARGTEIDFVATRNGTTTYYQVAYSLPDQSTRETDNLLRIRDNYRKAVITNTFEEVDEIDGVPIINVQDWLLGVNGADL